MARFFLSYHSEDRDIARGLEKGLEARGHHSVWGVDELIAGRGWGELMPLRLAEANAVIAILTPNTKTAPSVWCEIGAARALANTHRRTALLPVIIGLEQAPGKIKDMLVLWADGREENEEKDAWWKAQESRLVSEIDRAIQAHQAAIEADETRLASPKIFISHRHKDQKIAEALAETIRSAFGVKPTDIRCTSVQPYRLAFGKNTSERLRDEIEKAQVVLGILSPDTSESSYVMFELGAAWSRRIYTCPLLSGGADYSHIPGPIFDLAPARLWKVSDCHQLLTNLEAELELSRSSDTHGAVSERITSLAEAAKAAEGGGA